MSDVLDRRQLLAGGSAALGASVVLSASSSTAQGADVDPPFGYCLNMSTIRRADGKPRPITEQVEIAARAGYDAIEPWTREVQQHVEDGGSLSDLRKRIEDSGLTVESAIGFAPWLVDDETQRAQGLEAAKRDMEMLLAIGGRRLAAPPVGVTNQSGLNLLAAAERYRRLLEVGDQVGVIPELELWGFSKSMSRLGEVMFVAVESGHPRACILPDVYHIYKGGSDFEGLRLINGASIPVFHINDYPADPPRETIKDEHRVFPGEGVAPLTQILRMLHANGCRCMLSLELFNRDYWQRDPLEVARTGLEKMKAAVSAALA